MDVLRSVALFVPDVCPVWWLRQRQGSTIDRRSAVQGEAKCMLATTTPPAVDTVAAQILIAHTRLTNGCCRECLTGIRRLVPHPCPTVRWAALLHGHELTARFLAARARCC